MCAIKVFQLAKTCSEIIAGDIFRPDACGVVFVWSRMERGYEHVRNCGERLEKEKKEKIAGEASNKPESPESLQSAFKILQNWC